jgi:hypothetical protein
MTRFQRCLLAVCLFGGVLLTFIGIRFLVLPDAAARLFGVAAHPTGHEFHRIIGVRNIWLGLLAVGFAASRQWRALTLWFALGAIVCLCDAVIAAGSAGGLPQVAFHAGCGLCCIALAGALWRSR